VALRFNGTAREYYFNNALNLQGSWNDDRGFGNTRSNVSNRDETLMQHLEKPSYSIDNTLNLMKTIREHSYSLYFSTGYGSRPHTLTVSPTNYPGIGEASYMTQDALSQDFLSSLRLSYGLRLGSFKLNYHLWGNVSARNMDTELRGEASDGSLIPPVDSMKNDLWYNNYQAGINQDYAYEKGNFKSKIELPLTYYLLTIDDRIPDQFKTHKRWMLNPSLSLRYAFTNEYSISGGANFGRSFGDMSSSYTGFIMHGYRSLLRNTIDRLFETRSGGARASIAYNGAFNVLFINAGVNYNRSWRNLLYGYNYQGIMSVKTTIDQPSQSDGYNMNFNISKGLSFCPATVRLSGSYNRRNGEQLIQDEIFNYRSQGYSANAELQYNPASFYGFNYSFL
jgi:hypothetical protein